MKKVFIAVALVAVAFIGFSCKKDTARCWKVDSTLTVPEEGTETQTSYFWGTKSELEAKEKESAEDMKEEFGITVTFNNSEATQYATQADCEAQNQEK